MMSWNKGGTKRNTRVRLLRNIWLSSFRTMAKIRSLIRLPSCQFLPHLALRHPEYEAGEYREKQQLAPQQVHTDAFQKNAPHDGDEVTRRHHVGDDLDGHGHILDGVKKSRQQKRWKKGGDQPHLESEQLRPGQGRNQDAPEEG